MKLIDYIKTKASQTSLASFAEKCGTSAGQIKQVAYGNRRAGESLAINIDRETCGEVSCEELRPDVDWAHLRSSQPAPLQTPKSA